MDLKLDAPSGLPLGTMNDEIEAAADLLRETAKRWCVPLFDVQRRFDAVLYPTAGGRRRG